jgi:tRNA pseudouridine32 synthase/23S rRNA pseudouridine746 synthase/23S rRNA pseudouridine1911/1915/1917 synthase
MTSSPFSAEALQARVLLRDANLLVLDKPAGLAVHKGPKTELSLERFLPALRFGLKQNPELGHRLDRDTSGCLVLGRHHKALRKLGRLFSSNGVAKTYWAVVQGGPATDAGTIDQPLLKVTGRNGWRILPDPTGKPAVTDWRVLGRGPGIAWLELKPRTGRTHQIRVHCAEAGFPVIGDPVYGPNPKPDRMLHLHARAISLPYYETKPTVEVTAAPPAHMIEALRQCGN